MVLKVTVNSCSNFFFKLFFFLSVILPDWGNKEKTALCNNPSCLGHCAILTFIR